MKNIKYMFLSIAFLPVFMHAALEHDLMKLSRSMSFLTMALKSGSVETEPERLKKEKKQREQEELRLKKEKERLEKEEELRKLEQERLKEEEKRRRELTGGNVEKLVVDTIEKYNSNKSYIKDLSGEQFKTFQQDLALYSDSIFKDKAEKLSIGDEDTLKGVLIKFGFQETVAIFLAAVFEKMGSPTQENSTVLEDIKGYVDFDNELNDIKEYLETCIEKLKKEDIT